MRISPELWLQQHVARMAAFQEIRAWAEMAHAHAVASQQRATRLRTRAATLKREAEALRARWER